jgi:hypothetical protein
MFAWGTTEALFIGASDSRQIRALGQVPDAM